MPDLRTARAGVAPPELIALVEKMLSKNLPAGSTDCRTVQYRSKQIGVQVGMPMVTQSMQCALRSRDHDRRGDAGQASRASPTLGGATRQAAIQVQHSKSRRRLFDGLGSLRRRLSGAAAVVVVSA